MGFLPVSPESGFYLAMYLAMAALSKMTPSLVSSDGNFPVKTFDLYSLDLACSSLTMTSST